MEGDMLRDFTIGDITDPANQSDIIIGMNPKLSEASAIGRPFVKNTSVISQMKLGSVLTFRFDKKRLLHMLICHHIGRGGWKDADKYVRYSLDYLWQQHGGRSYSIVQIGKGPIGQRDGADISAIRTAMTTSFLEMDLYILPDYLEKRVGVSEIPIIPFRVWDMKKGEREIRV
jgi:hypothetical protein